MIDTDVIIVGGGPAGSTCAWKLGRENVNCIILDKKTFPRVKVCAGWITPKVVSDLEINLDDYPYSMVTFDKIYFHLYGRKIKFGTIQYSIRRYEFDAWLLERAGVPVYQHQVKNIIRQDDHYIIDDTYRCRYLVGAGGTYCPVYRTFFKEVNPREKLHLITALEAEFPYDIRNNECHLWFFENRLPGYSWYVPKGNNHLNIGIGGYFHKLKHNSDTIREQWDYFVNNLRRLSLVEDIPAKPKGYNYYLRQRVRIGQINKAYIIGDAAGLATKDMGEGIGPAVESGLLVADSILNGTPYSLRSITKSSIINILLAKYRYR